MQVKQGVRTKAARKLSLAVPVLASVAMSAVFAACGAVPMDESATDMSQSGAQEASHIRFLSDPNAGLTFAGTQSLISGTLTIGLVGGDTVVIARAATNNNITINGNMALGATVANTNNIVVTYSSGSAQNLILDYINGSFAMGKKGTTFGTTINSQGNVGDTLSIRMPNPTPAVNSNVTFAEVQADLNGDSLTDITFTKTGTGYVPTITVELGAGNDQFTGAGGQFVGGANVFSPAVGTTPDSSSNANAALHVYGGAGNDNIICGKGNDILNGGAGNDSFNGGTGFGGPVSFFGGDGVDSLSFAARTQNLTLTLNSNATSGQAGEGITIGVDIENVTGGAGDDTMSGSPVLGSKVTLTGGPGNDFFVQTGVSNDSNDTIVGGLGIDTIDYSGRTCNTNVTLEGTANDGCVGENDNVGTDVENVVTGQGADYVLGSAGNNRINGGTGINFLNGAGGDDIFDQGSDALISGSDTIVGGAGDDTVDYTQRTAAVMVSLTNTAVSGDTAATENDKLGIDVENGIGGAGGDTLVGNIDDNVLNGGIGTDTVNDCGGGSDIVLNCETFVGPALSNCGITRP